MLTVTTAALKRLSRALARKRAAADTALRFKRSGGRWRLRLDRARPNDATIAHKGRQVLLLDEAAAKAMSAMMLTVRDTESGPRLKLRKTTNTED